MDNCKVQLHRHKFKMEGMFSPHLSQLNVRIQKKKN